MMELQINKKNILENVKVENEMFSLTDLWKIAGSPKSKDPKFWLRQDGTVQLIEALDNLLKGDLKSPLKLTKVKRGNNGGTYGHKSIALSYAKYLDPKLHILVNEVFFERIEEEKNPDLIVDRAIKTYEKRGMQPEWITKRLHGKGVRNHFTSVLKKHGVAGPGYSECTNSMYISFYGKTASEVKEQKQVPKNKSLRETMSLVELSAIAFAESLAIDDIEKNRLYGNQECAASSNKAARIVSNSLKNYRNS